MSRSNRIRGEGDQRRRSPDPPQATRRNTTPADKIFGISQKLLSEQDATKFSELVTEFTCDLLQCRKAILYFLRDATLCAIDVNVKFPKHSRGVAALVARSGVPVQIDDCAKDPRFYPLIDRQTNYTTATCLAAPITTDRDQIIGVLEALNKKPDSRSKFTTDDCNNLNRLCKHIGRFILHTSVRDFSSLEMLLTDVDSSVARSPTLRPVSMSGSPGSDDSPPLSPKGDPLPSKMPAIERLAHVFDRHDVELDGYMPSDEIELFLRDARLMTAIDIALKLAHSCKARPGHLNRKEFLAWYSEQLSEMHPRSENMDVAQMAAELRELFAPNSIWNGKVSFGTASYGFELNVVSGGGAGPHIMIRRRQNAEAGSPLSAAPLGIEAHADSSPPYTEVKYSDRELTLTGRSDTRYHVFDIRQRFLSGDAKLTKDTETLHGSFELVRTYARKARQFGQDKIVRNTSGGEFSLMFRQKLAEYGSLTVL